MQFRSRSPLFLAPSASVQTARRRRVRFQLRFARLSAAPARRGLSLVEIVVVMMVMAIILLIFIPLTSGIFTRFSERDQASQLGAHLIFCRNAAIKSNRTVYFRIDLGEKKYRAWTLEREGATVKERGLVNETAINVAALSAAYGERLRDGAVVVNFLPSGVGEELAVYFGEGDNITQTLLFSRYTGEMKVVQGEAPLMADAPDWKEDLEDQ